MTFVQSVKNTRAKVSGKQSPLGSYDNKWTNPNMAETDRLAVVLQVKRPLWGYDLQGRGCGRLAASVSSKTVLTFAQRLILMSMHAGGNRLKTHCQIRGNKQHQESVTLRP